ncbi:tetratricopeptide repeat protein [Sediminibacterium roseum]|uniref:Tetratricopeptide repeat protein n=1 Tax=Sediminibacterium roseum TaxID=1978412 RepID=A0ABW9ZX29_9BACT|nr:tetratricopeptide repeat protein [Sediminibacterium roseum]NCI50794.1 tetratricopeptide repeat protein [Sediminibacterium roseum]
MRTWMPVFLLVFFIACKNESKNTPPDALAKEEMPAPVRQLFTDVDQHPDSTGLRLRLVDALDSLGAYRQALGQMDPLIKKDSLNYGLWYRKALLQENAHDTTGALKSYRYAIRIYPSPDAMLGAANLLAERKDSIALLLCKQIASLRIGREYTAHTHFISGVYYARTGNQQKAMDAFNACIANDYSYSEAYMEKGFLFYESKKIPEALQVFQTLSTVRNTYPDAYYWMAKCYESMNRRTEAIANYQRAQALDPKLTEAGEALKRLGAAQ